jgi:flagellar biosynthetic protein FliR
VDASAIAGWALSSLMLSLRLGPAFAFAPPFSLTGTPLLFRVLFAFTIAAAMVSAHPAAAAIGDLGAGHLVVVAARELVLGGIVAMVFQLMFAALYVAGRTIDIQAGFGLALLIDPTTRTQTPLIGTLFAYAAGAVFVALDGHAELLRIVSASVDAIPLGQGALPPLGRLTAFISGAFLIAFGVAGGVILALFLTDLSIAMLSRTVPQMNVLILGLQVKTLLLLLLLPAVFGVSGALLVRLARLTLESLPRLL